MEKVLILANRHPGGGFRRGNPVGGFEGFGLMRPMLSLLMIGLMVALIVLLVMNFRRPRGLSPLPAGPPTPPDVDPLETARIRFAKGEISRDEYLSLVSDLTEPRGEKPNPENQA